jgi:hypothetical protein
MGIEVIKTLRKNSVAYGKNRYEPLTGHSDFFKALIPEITFEKVAVKEKFNRDRNIIEPRVYFMQFFLDIHARMFDDYDEK